MFFNILDKEPIFAGYNPPLGRFYPLAFMDLNALMHLSSSPKLFFAFNALESIAMGAIVWHLAGRFYPRISIIALTLFVIFVNLGFVVIMSGICFPERNLMLLLSLFILSAYYIFVRNASHIALFALCFIAGLCSLFLKEPTFVFIGGFGVGFLALNALNARLGHSAHLAHSTHSTHSTHLAHLSKRQKALLFALIFIAVAFVAFYAAFILPQTQNAYTQTHSQKSLFILKGAIDVALNHAFIGILLPCLIIYRIYDFSRHKQIYPFYDALLLGAFGYMASFYALRLFGSYYFMPLYIMALLPTLFYFTLNPPKILRYILALCVVLHILINLPLALSTYTKTKIYPPHYLNATKFLATHSNLNAQNPTRIFMLGQNRNADGLMLYGFMARFMRHFGAENFDLLTNKPNPPSLTHAPNINENLSIFNHLEIAMPQKGDLLYLDSNSFDFVNRAYIEALDSRYERVYGVEYVGFYNVNLKALLKYAAINLSNSSLYARYVSTERVSSNIFGAPLGIYIWRVR